jgi:hypothetical protein
VVDQQLQQDCGDASAISVKSLGSSLDKKQTSLWKNLEKRLFANEPCYIFTSRVGEAGEEKDTEFFVLYDRDLPVGRATASLNRTWMEKKGFNLGFINDFIISPHHKEYAGLLIHRCLDALRAKGVEGAIVRSQSFPALAAQDLNGDVPPFCLPGNPPWYIDLFEKEGFIKHKEWASYRMKLPPRVHKKELERVNRSIDNRDMEIGKINIRSRREVDEFHDLMDIILWNHFGYTPVRFLEREDPHAKHVIFGFFAKLLKYRIYVLRDTSGKIVGCASFAPNVNTAARRFLSNTSRFRAVNLLKIVGFLISLRRIKRVEISVIGLLPEMRGKGFVRLIDVGLKAMVDAGYKELDTGPIMMENSPVIKMVGYVQKKYGLNPQHMRYYTLVYWFKDAPQSTTISPPVT